ncbi:MBL fold metallo-hydrolase [Ancylomarina euxinus]|uniref:MBL fold metallo-hydrolase n=1 Tax=Ancylomarina euxinus TaxID=2283627 RepID=A0A425Y8H9_9BACT|nr:MBL fold metallo-hydrolase [Ancylomarina euxinus]MCZ4693600.1 MBL fold metallo-hydrolase [Ancylomarina euxinus]MUP13828.1 MBL fold metallo-hydrolase [Ancylomarina euxinus]RRG24859.1 MBL fold metallo-hydrolase [Ancylomarina euxinus]
MQIYSIETGNFKCDGGAMFGVVPKIMWSKKYPADENNLCDCALRSMLIVDGDRRILIDNGTGDKQANSYTSHYHLWGEDSLKTSLKNVGFSFEDITDVIFTHLHFDHCGGATRYKSGTKELELVFPNATHWVSKAQWENYLNPNVREGDSYFPENVVPIFEAGKLNLVEHDGELFPNVEVRIFNGHTMGLMAVLVSDEDKTIAFTADFIPTMANVNLKWIAAYDLFPTVALKEKEAFLKEAAEKNFCLFFQHDIMNECCSLEQTARGIKPKDSFSLKSLF